MLLLDIIVRYPTVTLLLVFAALALRDGRSNKIAILGALVTISVAALLLGTTQEALRLPAGPHFIVRMLDIPSAALIWWFGRSLFEDDFELGWLEWLGMALIVFPVLWLRLTELGVAPAYPPALIYFVSGLSVAMMLHLVYVTLSGREDDVIETRRRVRFYFVIGLVATTILVVVVERMFYQAYPIEVDTFRAAITLPIVLFAFMWLLSFHPEKFSFQTVKAVATIPGIDPRDQVLHKSLLAQMEEHHAYTEPGLTIGILAEQLHTPEHRLRALINKGMGYRNFSSFLNHYRVIAVKQAMQMPENTRTPVLTLALNQGFNSLAPFNRAFRAITGQTPTAYRAELLPKAD